MNLLTSVNDVFVYQRDVPSVNSHFTTPTTNSGGSHDCGREVVPRREPRAHLRSNIRVIAKIHTLIYDSVLVITN